MSKRCLNILDIEICDRLHLKGYDDPNVQSLLEEIKKFISGNNYEAYVFGGILDKPETAGTWDIDMCITGAYDPPKIHKMIHHILSTGAKRNIFVDVYYCRINEARKVYNSIVLKKYNNIKISKHQIHCAETNPIGYISFEDQGVWKDSLFVRQTSLPSKKQIKRLDWGISPSIIKLV
jgi:hypothetical protein|tara:strand:- start:821 stop:1354 length:534 start_codon:yes stop_codon:yes gene_type:complete